MKKSFLKQLALLLSCLLAVGMFAACGGTSESAAGVDAAAGGSGDKVLEFWHIQSIEPQPTIIQDSVNRFIADHPDFSVNITVIDPDAYKQKIAVAISSGEVPDVFMSWGGGPMNEYANSGILTDLTPYMEADGYKDKFLDGAIAQSSYDGKIYAFPAENVATCNVFYNKEMFNENGISVPTTLSELESACDTLKGNGIIPFSLANKTQWTGSMYFMNFATRFGGVEPFREALAGTGSFENDNFEYAGTKIQEWVDKGYFNEGFNGADEGSGQSRQLLYTGDAAMTIMGSWLVPTVRGENPEYADKMGFFPFPAVEEGSGDPNIVIGTLGDNLYHISAACEYPDEAFEMLQHLLDDEAIPERIASGKTPPLKDMQLDDPLLQELFDNVEKAPDVQLWYDQTLPPEVSEVHKITSQEIFGKTMTPQEADTELQQAMEEYNSNS